VSGFRKLLRFGNYSKFEKNWILKMLEILKFNLNLFRFKKETRKKRKKKKREKEP
jgi:hypothetical protein